MKTALFFMLLLLPLGKAAAQTSESDKLITIEETRLKALVDGDIDLAASLHADNFELINPVGETLTKQQYLGGIEKGEIDYKVFEPISKIRVRISGNLAVLRYKSNIEITVGGNALPLRAHWHTDIYENIEGSWKIIWSQATVIE
ncbi:nuclear transport factor 2 family protein [Aegicerativicinus sediminis]|uniref:nuclear transport factor 2 family protein n=1 Tax=Aegicerativicinus sediminis TaxID=2893202 RepID=UPI001E4301C9|nr:nuclear transport factor 2 family protein [Aegicerativicinus sediminis]